MEFVAVTEEADELHGLGALSLRGLNRLHFSYALPRHLYREVRLVWVHDEQAMVPEQPHLGLEVLSTPTADHYFGSALVVFFGTAGPAGSTST